MKHIIYIILISFSFSLSAQNTNDRNQELEDTANTVQITQDSTEIRKEKVITITFNKKAFKEKMKNTKEKIVVFYDKQIEKHLERKEKRKEQEERRMNETD